MFSTLMTIIRGRREQVREDLESRNATVILEQKIREAEHGHETAKRSLASLILRDRNESRMVSNLRTRIRDLEGRARQALDADMEELATEAAQSIADLESELEARNAAVRRTRQGAQRLRLLIEKCDRRLVELRQGLISVRALDAERCASQELRGDISGVAALVEGEAVLKRVMGGADSIEQIDVLEEINAELSGEDLVDRLAAAGFGAPLKTRASDVLSRLRGEDTAPTPNPA
jgi:phage shock protein A